MLADHFTNEAELGWDRSEGSQAADPSSQECVGPSGQDPRTQDTGLRNQEQ
jgi:hypothetical protein